MTDIAQGKRADTTVIICCVWFQVPTLSGWILPVTLGISDASDIHWGYVHISGHRSTHILKNNSKKNKRQYRTQRLVICFQ